ncbi:hypothetical protein CSQ79_14880 [Gloeocapsopsis sp. IPPAS B-1203]|nr:hypothetical protein CSQ79_14880 [Gloeocapsopsis sp. IPPAS B-1203]
MQHRNSSMFNQGWQKLSEQTKQDANLDSRLVCVQEAVRFRYEQTDDPGHDWLHVMRVLKSCKQIGALVGADMQILASSALLHDLINVPKNSPKRSEASTAAAKASEDILRNAGYDDIEVQRIQRVIIEHSYSLGYPPSSIESAVLQDADRLDALGAIGIFRAATCGCRLGAAYYHLDDPFASDRVLDDQQYTVDHFFTKLLDLGKQMNTAPAQAIAEHRVSFLRDFLTELRLEIVETAFGDFPN